MGGALDVSSSGWDVSGVGGIALLESGGGILVVNVSSSDVLALSGDVVVSFGVVDNLGFDGQVLDSLEDSFNGFVLDDGLFNFLGDVFDLSFDSVVVGDGSFDWDSLGSGNFLIFDDFSLVRNSLDSLDLVVFDVLLLEGDVFDSGFDWDLFSDNFLSQALTDS